MPNLKLLISNGDKGVYPAPLFTNENYRNIKNIPHAKSVKSGAGFTLIESILYLAITSSMVFVISIFLGLVLGARVKNKIVLEVEQQGTFILQQLTRSLQESQAINSPLPGESSNELSLSSSVFPENPLVFNAGSGAMLETIGSQDPVPLNSPAIIIKNISFTNISASGTPGLIRIQLTLGSQGFVGLRELDYQADFNSSVSLR